MAKYRYTDEGLLDPTCLTPQMFYRMQSEVWTQGAEYEKERIIKLLDDLLVSLNGAYPTDYGLAATLRQLIKGETK